jgi:hypothetical protein
MNKCYDKFNQPLSEGDYVDVQKDGVHQIYKKEDGELYFKPYGKEDMVSSYFSNDMVKCDEVGIWITDDMHEDIIEEPKQTDWEFEISSGYNGYRNKITSDWIYESEYLKIFNGFKQETPNELDSVLAKITHQNDLGLSQWYEVVYYADDKWCSYSGSKTFEDGERVIEWKYCKELF